MDTIEALKWRYAAKKFDDNKIVPQSILQRIIEGFNLTPTSYGLQPLKLVVISNKDLKDELFRHSFNQQQVKTASHLLVICREKRINQAFIEDNFELIKSIRETPDEILSPFREFLIKDFNEKTDDEISKWANNQAYLALGNVLTICALEKIDASPMEGFLPHKYDEVLDLKSRRLKSVLVCAIGYRSNDDEFASFKKVRRPLSETIIEIK
ncbi:MAG: NAD(P)H-dependent oxidoreductase [Psychroflexus salarius]|jgi:nitroreductase